MARRKKSEMTYAQRVTEDNDKFRKDALATALDEPRLERDTTDIDKFRRNAYKQALRDAKETR